MRERQPVQPTERQTLIPGPMIERPRTVVVCRGAAFDAHRLPEKGTVTIGRGKTTDIVVLDGSISREHARLHVGDEVALEDLGSSNGTRLRGLPLQPNTKHAVGIGDAAMLGSVTLVFTAARAQNESAREELLACDPATQHVRDLVLIAAKADIPVLITGETGVGKEVFAAAIHRHSVRPGRFVRVNCAAIPEALLERELFGHARGAFTGATDAREGLIEAASGGTLFLDEVGELPLAAQAKLLRVLENGEVTRLGSTTSAQVAFRLVSATNRKLKDMVRTQRFRADLYYRMNGVRIEIPALRDRPGDILPLAEHLVTSISRERPIPLRIAPSAEDALLHHDWPGNVRELKSTLERAALLVRGSVIEAEDLMLESESFGDAEPDTQPRSWLGWRDDAERERIEQALRLTDGNQTEAAKMLGISRRTMINRIEHFGLPRPRKARRAS
jgi:DNA-binding NtrC family response regulator